MTTSLTDRIARVTANLAIKAPCKYATTGNISLRGLGTRSGAPWVASLTAGDRILVMSQTNGVENGIYNAAAGEWSRAQDFDNGAEITQGTRVSVLHEGGTSITREVTTSGSIVIDESEILFSDSVGDEYISAAYHGFSTQNTGAQNLTALTDAIAAALGRVIDIGEGDFYLAPGLGLDCILRGRGRARTRIYKSGNGDLVNFYTNAGLVDISLYGAGATYTGRGLVIAAGEGQQVCHNANIGDFEGYCIDFTDTTAGSQSFWDKMKIYRTGGTGASYAVRIEDAAESAAYPRHFSNIESEGTRFIDLGGCNGLFVDNSYIGEVQYSDNSRGAMFAACRYGSNSTAVTMRGYNHTIVGCNVSPIITLASGVGECAITGNSYNNAIPIVDNSGNGGRNIIDTVAYAYTPTLTSGGTAPTLGNGTLTAVVTRHGAMISVTYNLAIGSTTNLGTGELRFSLPTTPVSTGSGVVQHVGQCVCYDSSGNSRVYGHIAVTPGVAYATCATETDVVFVNGPFTWATGDWLRATVTYPA